MKSKNGNVHATQVKRFIAMAIVFAMCFSLVGIASAATAEPTPESSATLTDSNPAISPMSINTANTITIKGGGSKKFEFNMSAGLFGLGTPHNAFDVLITNVSSGSKYTLSITYDGVELHNAQYTGNTGRQVWNCSKGQKWIVLIVNDRSQDMSCTVDIKSYIK
ncbi:hypothetical protein FACS1894217_07120 [Clostridia bacterium]|nr:hypothetical protein FACS1894217_07120 [Clostridia bacterium]